MNTQQKALYSLLFIFVLISISIYLVFPVEKSTKLGLDLKGGMSVILTAQATKKAPITEDKMDQAKLVIEKRVNRLGVSEASVQRSGIDNILIQLPGIKNPQKALDIIGKTAILEFKPVLADDQAGGDNFTLGPTEMSGDALSSARATYDDKNEPVVLINFTSKGKKQFADVTTRYVQKKLAIVLDGEVISAPVINEPIIQGNAEISGLASIDEAKEIALVLQTGALPVKLVRSEVREVGPTLGKESLIAGLRAGIIGLILVAIYMAIYYRGLGLVTSLALVVFSTIFWGVIAFISRFIGQWSLTLPGIAGIILSIGLAADSSIIIFERIKEEVRSGKSFRVAVDSGFENAFRTIMDADFCTVAAAFFLYWLAIGPVKGFALTLIIGIVIDITTAFFFTHSILRLLALSKRIVKPYILGVKETT